MENWSIYKQLAGCEEMLLGNDENWFLNVSSDDVWLTIGHKSETGVPRSVWEGSTQRYQIEHGFLSSAMETFLTECIATIYKLQDDICNCVPEIQLNDYAYDMEEALKAYLDLPCRYADEDWYYGGLADDVKLIREGKLTVEECISDLPEKWVDRDFIIHNDPDVYETMLREELARLEEDENE